MLSKTMLNKIELSTLLNPAYFISTVFIEHKILYYLRYVHKELTRFPLLFQSRRETPQTQPEPK